MFPRSSIRLVWSLVLIANVAAVAQTPLGSAITYQGQLKQSNSPANGSFNMVFKLWNDVALSAPANQIGPTLTFNGIGGNPPAVAVANGLFTVQLNFGGSAFNGDKRWLEIAVSGTTLAPRQELTATPYARFSTAPWGTLGANISNTNSGNVGIGTASPAQKLSVAGAIESTSGGIKFPDGTIQSTAASLPGTVQNVIVGWGLNTDGQTDAPSGTFSAVSAGTYHSLGLRTDGTIAGWGYNGDGQINVPAGTHIAVAAGVYHSLAIRTDGTLVGWGYNGNGQTTVPSGTYTAIAAGYAHSLAIRTDGTLAGWGFNGQGQITVPSGTFIAVAAGQDHSLAIRSNGTLVGWGENSDGQVNVPAGTFIAVAGGGYHSVAVRSDGTLVGWGYNGDGQTDVPTGTFTKVAAGYDFSIGIRTDGTLAGCGDNFLDQISVPSRICLALACGDSHALGIFSSLILDGGVIAGAATLGGPTSIDGQLTVSGIARFQNNVTIAGKVAVGSNFPRCSLDVSGSVRARGGAPGSSGGNNNGFAFEVGGDSTTGMYSLTSGQLDFYTGPSERMRINSSGNVGIGTNNPTTRLSVEGGSDTQLTGGGYLQLGATAASNISIDDNEIMARSNGATSGLFLNHDGGNVLISALGTGNVGIGTANPAQRLHVIGNICATGSIGACSDERFKTNINTLQGALSIIDGLRPVRFDWRQDQFPDRKFGEDRQIGLIAQEVRRIAPEVVQEGSDGYFSVDYGRLTPVLIQAMKEQQQQIEATRNENAELRARLERIEERMNASQGYGGGR